MFLFLWFSGVINTVSHPFHKLRCPVPWTLQETGISKVHDEITSYQLQTFCGRMRDLFFFWGGGGVLGTIIILFLCQSTHLFLIYNPSLKIIALICKHSKSAMKYILHMASDIGVHPIRISDLHTSHVCNKQKSYPSFFLNPPISGIG